VGDDREVGVAGRGEQRPSALEALGVGHGGHEVENGTGTAYPRPVRTPAIKRSSLLWLLVFVVVAGLLVRGASIVALLLAALVVGVLFRIGFAMLRGLAQPIPEPPPAGELRKVKIMYRCSICGTEVRMTTANDQMPDAPRHCLEDMDLVTPVDDL
jgi:hypothetical protein